MNDASHPEVLPPGMGPQPNSDMLPHGVDNPLGALLGRMLSDASGMPGTAPGFGGAGGAAGGNPPFQMMAPPIPQLPDDEKVAILTEVNARYQNEASWAWPVGSIVTVNPRANMIGIGEPMIVVHNRYGDYDFDHGDPQTEIWGRRQNTRVAMLIGQKIAYFWLEGILLEKWEPKPVVAEESAPLQHGV